MNNSVVLLYMTIVVCIFSHNYLCVCWVTLKWELAVFCLTAVGKSEKETLLKIQHCLCMCVCVSHSINTDMFSRIFYLFTGVFLIFARGPAQWELLCVWFLMALGQVDHNDHLNQLLLFWVGYLSFSSIFLVLCQSCLAKINLALCIWCLNLSRRYPFFVFVCLFLSFFVLICFIVCFFWGEGGLSRKAVCNNVHMCRWEYLSGLWICSCVCVHLVL